VDRWNIDGGATWTEVAAAAKNATQEFNSKEIRFMVLREGKTPRRGFIARKKLNFT
jgi:hypothetical protein